MLPDEDEIKRRAKFMAENGGVQPMHRVFYSSSIRYSAECAMHAFYFYDHLLSDGAEAWHLVSTVQEAIGHAGALSRYFWPPVREKETGPFTRLKVERGAALRAEFGLSNDSPLKDQVLRNTRNAWEHFDERLDRYLLTHSAGYFSPEPIIGSHEMADSPVEKVFKLIDTDASCLVLLGQKFFFGPIRNEVRYVLTRFAQYRYLANEMA